MLSVDDRLAIHELFARYARSLDDEKAADFVSLFSRTGEWTGHGQSFKGHKALNDMAIAYFAHPDVTTTKHWANQVIITGDGDSAHADSYGACFSTVPDGNALQLEVLCRYADDLVKIDGEWLFERREVYDSLPRAIDEFEFSPSGADASDA